jgi:hypothetical protein
MNITNLSHFLSQAKKIKPELIIDNISVITRVAVLEFIHSEFPSKESRQEYKNGLKILESEINEAYRKHKN